MARDRDLLRLDRHGIAAESLGSELSSDMEVLPFFPQTLRMPKGAPEMVIPPLFSVSHEQGSDWSRMTGMALDRESGRKLREDDQEQYVQPHHDGDTE
jgi:hypothetical protein